MSDEKKVLKELNDEELDSVNGGYTTDEKASYLPADHGAHIGMYDAENYIGQKFYIVKDSDPQCYYWGTLLKSWEKNTVFWFTSRNHILHIDGTASSWPKDYLTGQDQEFAGCYWTLFLMH